MKFIPVEWSVEGWKEAAEEVFKKKASVIYVQAPRKFQPLIAHFIRGLSPWDRFLQDIAARTGIPNPEKDPRTAWVHAVKMARNLAAKVVAIEPDFEGALLVAAQKLTIKNKEPVLQEARLWYLSREGFLKRLIRFFDFPVQFLPQGFRLKWVNFWLNLYGLMTNILPGDQRDFVAAVAMTDLLLARKMAEILDQQEDEGLVLVDKWYCDSVRKALLEIVP